MQQDAFLDRKTPHASVEAFSTRLEAALGSPRCSAAKPRLFDKFEEQ
jgi:hypothetical protein